ncbi:MAG: hypothetical protein IJU72_00415 [Bacteroidales bacterium]|nr:hypothetical protein [Bacteroidales bacterium]
MSEPTIPPKNRPEWAKLVSGEIDHEFQNYVLQLRIYQLRKDIAAGKLTIQKAVDDLFLLCSKYMLAVQPDCKKIFKTW